MKKPAVGQILFLAYNENPFSSSPSLPREGYEVVVTKVGRKWVHFNRAGGFRGTGCFDVATGEVDAQGYSSHCTVYLDREDWQAQILRRFAFSTLRRLVSQEYRPADGVTLGHIRQVACLLCLERQLDDELAKRRP